MSESDIKRISGGGGGNSGCVLSRERRPRKIGSTTGNVDVPGEVVE